MYDFLSKDSFRLQFLKSCVRLHGLCIEMAMASTEKAHSSENLRKPPTI